jgi:hypothetical protein
MEAKDARVLIMLADPGCLSRIPVPDFFSIPDPGFNKQQKRSGKH